jgi:hypothetical protein
MKSIIYLVFGLVAPPAFAAIGYNCSLQYADSPKDGVVGSAEVLVLSADKIAVGLKIKGEEELPDATEMDKGNTSKVGQLRFVEPHNDGDGFFVTYLPTEAVAKQQTKSFNTTILQMNNDAGGCDGDGDDCRGEYVLYTFAAACSPVKP